MKRRDFVKNTGLAAGNYLLLNNSLAHTSLQSGSNKHNIEKRNVKNICKTCGTRYHQANYNPNECPVCLDDRQYVGSSGQQWVSYSELAKEHTIQLNRLQENVLEISIIPSFAIGQRAHLISTPEGNILWDCIPYIDAPTIAYIKELGGLKAIAISHPHYYSLMHEWAKVFDCPIYIHDHDRKWVMDLPDRVSFWSDKKLRVLDGVELIHVGGHFPGSSVMNFTPKNGTPSLFVGDSFYVSIDKQFLSAMYSYPNNIPLPKSELFTAFHSIENLEFEKIYGAFHWQNILSGGKDLMKRSIERYHNIYTS